MLTEIPHARQDQDSATHRRWFTCPTLDLIVWLDRQNQIAGFQLCYDKGQHECALTWRQDSGYTHMAVDDGEGQPGKYKSTPLLVPDGNPDTLSLAEQFKKEAGALDVNIAKFVSRKLTEHTSVPASS